MRKSPTVCPTGSPLEGNLGKDRTKSKFLERASRSGGRRGHGALELAERILEHELHDLREDRALRAVDEAMVDRRAQGHLRLADDLAVDDRGAVLHRADQYVYRHPRERRRRNPRLV